MRLIDYLRRRVRLEVRRVFLWLMTAGGPGSVVVEIFLEDDRLVGGQRVAVSRGGGRLLEYVVRAVVHRERRACRVGRASARGRAYRHRRDRRRIGQSAPVHRVRACYVRRQMPTTGMNQHNCYRMTLARRSCSRRQTVASVPSCCACKTI